MKFKNLITTALLGAGLLVGSAMASTVFSIDNTKDKYSSTMLVADVSGRSICSDVAGGFGITSPQSKSTINSTELDTICFLMGGSFSCNYPLKATLYNDDKCGGSTDGVEVGVGKLAASGELTVSPTENKFVDVTYDAGTKTIAIRNKS